MNTSSESNLSVEWLKKIFPVNTCHILKNTLEVYFDPNELHKIALNEDKVLEFLQNSFFIKYIDNLNQNN